MSGKNKPNQTMREKGISVVVNRKTSFISSNLSKSQLSQSSVLRKNNKKIQKLNKDLALELNFYKTENARLLVESNTVKNDLIFQKRFQTQNLQLRTILQSVSKKLMDSADGLCQALVICDNKEPEGSNETSNTDVFQQSNSLINYPSTCGKKFSGVRNKQSKMHVGVLSILNESDEERLLTIPKQTNFGDNIPITNGQEFCQKTKLRNVSALTVLNETIEPSLTIDLEDSHTDLPNLLFTDKVQHSGKYKESSEKHSKTDSGRLLVTIASTGIILNSPAEDNAPQLPLREESKDQELDEATEMYTYALPLMTVQPITISNGSQVEDTQPLRKSQNISQNDPIMSEKEENQNRLSSAPTFIAFTPHLKEPSKVKRKPKYDPLSQIVLPSLNFGKKTNRSKKPNTKPASADVNQILGLPVSTLPLVPLAQNAETNVTDYNVEDMELTNEIHKTIVTELEKEKECEAIISSKDEIHEAIVTELEKEKDCEAIISSKDEIHEAIVTELEKEKECEAIISSKDEIHEAIVTELEKEKECEAITLSKDEIHEAIVTELEKEQEECQATNSFNDSPIAVVPSRRRKRVLLSLSEAESYDSDPEYNPGAGKRKKKRLKADPKFQFFKNPQMKSVPKNKTVKALAPKKRLTKKAAKTLEKSNRTLDIFDLSNSLNKSSFIKPYSPRPKNKASLVESNEEEDPDKTLTPSSPKSSISKLKKPLKRLSKSTTVKKLSEVLKDIQSNISPKPLSRKSERSSNRKKLKSTSDESPDFTLPKKTYSKRCKTATKKTIEEIDESDDQNSTPDTVIKKSRKKHDRVSVKSTTSSDSKTQPNFTPVCGQNDITKVKKKLKLSQSTTKALKVKLIEETLELQSAKRESIPFEQPNLEKESRKSVNLDKEPLLQCMSSGRSRRGPPKSYKLPPLNLKMRRN